MLPFLLVLVLSSASQDTLSDQSSEENDSSLKPDPVDSVAKIISNVSISTVRRTLPSAVLRQKSPVNSKLSSLDNKSNLRWVKWDGSLPNGAVSIYNTYTERIDYVCKYRCHSGFYNRNMGSYCHYPYEKEEHRSPSFQILVNEKDLEVIEWKKDSYGSVPQNSIRTCSSEEMYVGRNEYGLGKVDLKDRCFYLPWKGSQYWYWSYEVLTYIKASEVIISGVRYNINQAKKFKDPPKTMKTSTATNRGDSPVTKTVSLRQTTKDERRWDISSSITVGVRTTIKAGIPGIVENSIEVSAETTHTFSGGNTWTEEISHEVSLQLTVPPRKSCTVKMVGYRYKMDIPFTAILSRTYENGETKSVTISGTYDGVQVGDVQAQVDKCVPLSNSELLSNEI